jgi:low temperature requirement protein LtrA
MNIIVLGETLLAAVLAIRAAIAGGGLGIDLGIVATAATVTAFGMWWLYFTDDEHLDSEANQRAFVWGYGHFLIFAAAAAAGAGFAVQVDLLTEHAHLTRRTADLAVAIPVAVYMFGLWLVRDRYCLQGAARPVLLVGAALALATPLLPHSLVLLAVLVVACIIVRGELACRSIGADAGARP